MRCCICGQPVEQWGNNPYPLCSKNDYESRCCDLCNDIVIHARCIISKQDIKNIQIGDMLVIFYSENSELPTQIIATSQKCLAGNVESILKSDDQKSIKYEGSWGNFIVDSETDSFAKVS